MPIESAIVNKELIVEIIAWIFGALGLGILTAIGAKLVDHGPTKMKNLGAWIIVKAAGVKNIVLMKRHEKFDIDLVELAKEYDVPIAVEKSGYDPTIVTWTNGRRSYHYANQNTYVNNRGHGFEAMTNSTMKKVPLLPREMSLAQKREKMKAIKSSKSNSDRKD